MTFENEYKDRLNIVREMISARLGEVQDGTRDMLTSTQAFLYDLLDVAAPTCITQSKPTQIVISTFFLDRKDEVSWIAVNISQPNNKEHMFARPIPYTRNTSSYDAIYEGLTSLFGTVNNPDMPVEVHCADYETVWALNNEGKLFEKEAVARKRESILSLIKELPVKVTIKWQPVVSTPIMKSLKNILYRAEEHYLTSKEKSKC